MKLHVGGTEKSKQTTGVRANSFCQAFFAKTLQETQFKYIKITFVN